MGLTLTNEQIDLTYPGLIKMNDNVGVTAVLKPLSDGIGTNLPFEVSTTGVNFTGTVTGISAGGLVAGTGSNSMRSSDALTTTAANASGSNSIALGDSASVTTSDSVVIGVGCNSSSGPSITIGRYSSANGSVSTAIGNSATVSADQSIGISGENCTVSAQRSVGIGRQVTITGSNSIAIGNFAKVTANASMYFSSSVTSPGEQKATNSLMMVPGSYGCTTAVGATNSIVLGSSQFGYERASNVGSISIGYSTRSTADNAVALGASVIANRANTTSVTELETQAVGGGVVMYSPNGTGYKLTVSDVGDAVFTAI